MFLSVLVDSHPNHSTINMHSNINLMQALIKASKNTSEAVGIFFTLRKIYIKKKKKDLIIYCHLVE